MPEPDPSSQAEPTPAAEPESPPEPTGRDRLFAALQRPGSRGQLVVAVLLAVLGFAAAVQVHEQNQTQGFVGARQGDLISLINTLSLATDRTEADINRLRNTRDSLRNDAQASRTALSVARQRAEALGILAGTIPAVGPGIRVTVDAKPGTVGTDQLLDGIEELRNAGAEAMEINDTVRVVAQTSIEESPSGDLKVDGQSLSPPYVIDVIGDPHTLATALQFEGGFSDDVKAVGGNVSIDELDHVEVSSTRSANQPHFAKPSGQ
jgi:uncharacterized protein YlxW (UPF0749 family)